MNKIRLPLYFATALTLGSIGAAQITTDTIFIGGSGSLSSAGSSNPGKLDDGITVATATYEFTLDTVAKTLKVKITNTSPVLVGVPNPLLTDVFFNLPTQVTGATLTTQTSSGGVTPAYALVFDADRNNNPNPNGADGFGAFSIAISDTGNIQGTIANPNADTYTVAGTLLAISPVTFTLTLTGTLTGLTADDITALLSHIPPGANPSQAVGKFQAGGVASASAFINDGNPCQSAATSVVLGAPCGGSLTVSPPVPGGFSTVTYNGSTPVAPAIVMFSHAGGTPFSFNGCTMFTQAPTKVGMLLVTDGNGDFQASNPIPPTHHVCGQQLVIQAMVIDPNNPNKVLEVSNGVLVTMGF